jgi:hypothetical protein
MMSNIISLNQYSVINMAVRPDNLDQSNLNIRLPTVELDLLRNYAKLQGLTVTMVLRLYIRNLAYHTHTTPND